MAEPLLPEGHPIPWDQLRPYEQQQGGYWLYPDGRDVFGNDKIWVKSPNPDTVGTYAALPKDQFIVQVEDTDGWTQLSGPYNSLKEAEDRMASSRERGRDWKMRVVRARTTYVVIA